MDSPSKDGLVPNCMAPFYHFLKEVKLVRTLSNDCALESARTPTHHYSTRKRGHRTTNTFLYKARVKDAVSARDPGTRCSTRAPRVWRRPGTPPWPSRSRASRWTASIVPGVIPLGQTGCSTEAMRSRRRSTSRRSTPHSASTPRSTSPATTGGAGATCTCSSCATACPWKI